LNHRASTYPVVRVAFLLFFLCAALERDTPVRAGTAQDPPAFRAVPDDTGRSIRVAVPVRRVVSLSPA